MTWRGFGRYTHGARLPGSRLISYPVTNKRFDARGNRPIGDGEPAPSAKVDIAEGEIEGCELRSSVAVAMLSAVAT